MLFRKKDGNLCEKNILDFNTDTQYYNEIKDMFDLIQKSNYSNQDGINQQNDTPKYVESLVCIENALNKVNKSS